MKEIIIPGELIANEPLDAENIYVEGGKSYAKILGLLDREKRSLVPLEGIWSPRIGDIVVGIVSGSKNSVYDLDLSYFCRSILIGSKYDRQSYKNGDIIESIVKDIEDRKTIILSGPKVLYGGTIMNVKPSKVPRIIGKENTMIAQISDMTKCHIVAGKNGIIWLKGGDIGLAVRAIRCIEEEAHTSGLTERIKAMLNEKKAINENEERM